MKVFIVIFLMILMSFDLKSQNSLIFYGDVIAKVGVSLSLYENTSLCFGSISKPTTSGTVTVDVDNFRYSSSGVILLPQLPVFQTGYYSVYGSKNEHYNVIVPNNNVVSISNNISNMNVNNFTVKTESKGKDWGKLNHIGEDHFIIGATLYLNNNQPSGYYTGYYTIIVIYN